MLDKKYLPEDFPYPLNEDIQAIYDAREILDRFPDDDMKLYLLKKAIYEMTLTMKSMCVEGELRQDTRDDLADYFWGFLL